MENVYHSSGGPDENHGDEAAFRAAREIREMERRAGILFEVEKYFHFPTTLSRMSYAETSARKAATLAQIRKLIDCLVNIKDETGEFLMPLEDGRVIDTKGWNDWEVSV